LVILGIRLREIANYFSGSAGGLVFCRTELWRDFRLGRERAGLDRAVRNVTAMTQAGHWRPRPDLECHAPQTRHWICGLIGVHPRSVAAQSPARGLEIDASKPTLVIGTGRLQEIAKIRSRVASLPRQGGRKRPKIVGNLLKREQLAVRI